MVTVVVSWLVDGGLKLEAAPEGSPLQEKLMAPRPALESTTKSMEVELPFTTCRLLPLPEICNGGPMCVGSVAVLLLGFTSPPPETVAVLVTLAWMLIGTFTVRVIGG